MISSLHRRSSGDREALDNNSSPESDDVSEVLEAEDVAAELLSDSEEPPTNAMPRRGLSETRALAPPTKARPPTTCLQPSAASLATRLEEAEAELTRVRRQMRARDAYLAELEQALQASTSKLEASGIGSVDDAHRLFGRLRGQAFRIAELESELRTMERRVSRLARLLPPGVAG